MPTLQGKRYGKKKIEVAETSKTINMMPLGKLIMSKDSAVYQKRKVHNFELRIT